MSQGKTVLPTTYKKDGTPVGTPVWVAPAGAGSCLDHTGLIGLLAIGGHKLLRGADLSVGIAIDPRTAGDLP